MAVQKNYRTKPIQLWNKAKELRAKYYQDYVTVKEKGGLRWSGGAYALDALVAGLGDDVHGLTSEPYAASIASDPKFSRECLEATASKGYARDLCSYLRNYLGSVILNKYYFGGPFPKPDFILTYHICCQHAKWYQAVRDLEGDIPMFAIDISIGPWTEINENRIRYVAEQSLDAIDWLQKVTKRKYDDERLIQAVNNQWKSNALWAEICIMNQNIPAPLDEKTMYSLYVLGVLHKSCREYAEFYQELRDEVKDRVDNQIAAVATERVRIMTDSQPPWAFLKLWRYLEEFGVVSVGSLYVFFNGVFERLADGTWIAAKTPQQMGQEIKTREQAVWSLAELELAKRPVWTHDYSVSFRIQATLDIARQWHCEGAIMHLNRGCEAASLNQLEVKAALSKAGLAVMTYEGNMADDREFDEPRAMRRLDIFLKETLGLEKLRA